MKRYLLYIICMFAAASASAQKYPERGMVRKGNRAYDKGRYERSIERYENALRVAPDNYEAIYDLGNALHRAERYDKAAEMLGKAAADTLRTPEERAEAWFNLGNTQLAQQKLQDALESYKNSLRMNPADEQAKYNYVYVKRLLQEQEQNQDQQNQQGGDGGGDDEQQDPNRQNQQDSQDDGSGDDSDSDREQGDDRQDEGQPEQGDDEDDRQGEAPAEPRISPEEQERMLDAIQAEEDKTQDKLNEKARGVVVRGRKNW
ncbi:MAG: tetratricopeptide repeat protein [Alistipes sp.]|nr:tetratricopeptide repeat protein [Alistipes sp.]